MFTPRAGHYSAIENCVPLGFVTLHLQYSLQYFYVTVFLQYPFSIYFDLLYYVSCIPLSSLYSILFSIVSLLRQMSQIYPVYI